MKPIAGMSKLKVSKIEMSKYLILICMFLIVPPVFGDISRLLTPIYVNTFYEGGWTSGGGGEIVRDSSNPWFLKANTNQIKYCILIGDENEFGLDREALVRLVDQAFAYWRSQIQYGFSFSHGIEIQSERYALKHCSDPTDLSELNRIDLFLMFGFLPDGFKDPKNDVIKKFQNDLQNHIAFTVRTHYDRERMKGKGFIYVTPKKGELSLQDQISEKFDWSSKDGQKQLLWILIHEIGHVYGIPHLTEGFMSKYFVEDVLSLKDWALTQNIYPISTESFLRNKTGFPTWFDFEVCMDAYTLKSQEETGESDSEVNPINYKFSLMNFLNAENDNCLQQSITVVNPMHVNLKITTFSSTDKRRKYAKASLRRSYLGEDNELEIIRIWIPNNQRVFLENQLKDHSGKKIHYVSGTVQKVLTYKGALQLDDGLGTELGIIMTVKPGSITIGGVKDGKYYPDINFSSYL